MRFRPWRRSVRRLSSIKRKRSGHEHSADPGSDSNARRRGRVTNPRRPPRCPRRRVVGHVCRRHCCLAQPSPARSCRFPPDRKTSCRRSPARRVTTAACQVESFVAPITAVPAPVVVPPAQNPAPILNIGPPVVSPPSQPEFFAPERPATSSLQPQSTTWSTPQIGSGSGSSNSSSIEEPRSASGDQFDMPLNQVGQ